MKCIFSLFKSCDAQNVLQYTSHFVKAVNKLCDAAGVPSKKLEHTAETWQITLENSIQTVKCIAEKFDDLRLERIAAEDAARGQDSEISLLRQNIAQLAGSNENLAHANESLKKKSEEIQSTLDKQAAVTNSSGKKRRELAISLIKFRDQLLYFQDEFREDGDERAVKLLGNLYKETGRFMNENGIESLEESGSFCTELHTVRNTEITDQSALENTIANTFRAGYRIDGELYRPQEIALYVQKT